MSWGDRSNGTDLINDSSKNDEEEIPCLKDYDADAESESEIEFDCSLVV